MFEGELVYIEFTSEGRVFTIITEQWEKKRPPLERYSSTLPDPFPVYREYDVDYCDSHEHYHAHVSGGGRFPQKLSNKVNEQHEHVAYKYWIAPHLGVEHYEGTDPAYCIAIESAELIPLILTDDGYREEFLSLHPEPTGAELLNYWYEEAHGVEEGQVVWCDICGLHYDYEEYIPCEHIRWCDSCGMFSTPGGECEHRSEDGKFYVEPVEPVEA